MPEVALRLPPSDRAVPLKQSGPGRVKEGEADCRQNIPARYTAKKDLPAAQIDRLRRHIAQEQEEPVKKTARQRAEGHPLHGGEPGGGEQLQEYADAPPQTGGGDNFEIGFVHACLSFRDGI